MRWVGRLVSVAAEFGWDGRAEIHGPAGKNTGTAVLRRRPRVRCNDSRLADPFAADPNTVEDGWRDEPAPVDCGARCSHCPPCPEERTLARLRDGMTLSQWSSATGIYLATQHFHHHDGATGTGAPRMRVNYGAWPGLQLHGDRAPGLRRGRAAVPHPTGWATSAGREAAFLSTRAKGGPWWDFPANLRCRLATRLMGWGPGTCTCCIPLWLQKSFGAWTNLWRRGSVGEPGNGKPQLRVPRLAIPAPPVAACDHRRRSLLHHARSVGGDANLRFNVGAGPRFHRSITIPVLGRPEVLVGDTILQGYAAYQLTL